MRKVLFILGVLEDSDLEWLLEAGEPRRVSEGDEILCEECPVEDLHVVIDGELVVRKADLELARLGAGVTDPQPARWARISSSSHGRR